MSAMYEPVASPCVKLCQLDRAGRVCLGCGRTLDEIAGWARMSDGDRRQVIARLAGRAVVGS